MFGASKGVYPTLSGRPRHRNAAVLLNQIYDVPKWKYHRSTWVMNIVLKVATQVVESFRAVHVYGYIIPNRTAGSLDIHNTKVKRIRGYLLGAC